MKRSKWIWTAGILAVGIGAALVAVRAASQDEAAFQEQLRLARAEGLPTTAAEYAALVPKASPEENAAPLYREMGRIANGPIGSKTDVAVVNRELIFHPGAPAVAAAESLIKLHRRQIELAADAAKLPKCWFDRDWRLGAAVLFPEYAQMKSAAKLLAVRGSLAANRRDAEAALADCRGIFAIADHAGQEPHGISRMVREAIYVIGLQNLTYWAFAHRDQSAYRAAIKRAIDAFPRPNVKDEHRDSLFLVLSMIELTSTTEGRTNLGLREEDIGWAEKVIPILKSRADAKPQIVKAMRDKWAALDRPPKDRAALIDKATKDLDKALFAYPTAADIYEKLTSGGDSRFEREAAWEARKQQYIAALRALDEPRIPTTIRTDDLLSPFDGKPLSYRYDGKQIVISISGYDNDSGPVFLKIPPDEYVD
jgi:hypothetical protein